MERANFVPANNPEIQKEKIYFLDLDSTLINTEDFFAEIRRLATLHSSDMAREIAEQVAEYRKKYGSSAMYNPCDTLKQDPEVWRAVVDEIDVEKFIYNDAVDFVKKLMADTAIQLMILTYGYDDYQQLKVKGTFLEDLPMKVVDTAKKTRVIGEMLNKDGQYIVDLEDQSYTAPNVVLVDDNVAAFSDSESLVNFMGYLIQRDEEKDDAQDLPDNVQLIRDFSDIEL